MAAIQSALDLPEAELPVVESPPKLPRGIGPLVDLLRVLLKFQCEQHHVAQRLVATTADLEAIAAFDKPDVPALRGWRFEVFGRAAQTLKQGKVGLAVTNGEVAVVPMSDVRAPA
jgi:ribonuclease D